jgi:hypothetical protein
MRQHHAPWRCPKFTGKRSEDPREDDGLHAIPSWVRSVGEDVVGEFLALHGELNLIAPLGVACRSRSQNSRDKRVNVLYPAGLRVKHGDDGSVTPGGWGGGVFEENAVVGASFKAPAANSKAAAEARSSSRRRAMART